MAEPSIEIPMFREDESLVVAALFAQNGIRHRREILHLGADPWGGHHAYTFRVAEEHFDAAIALLKDAFGLRTGSGDLAGTCPACGAAIEAAERCPECDLNLSSDYGAVSPKHPFVRFLKQHGLL